MLLDDIFVGFLIYISINFGFGFKFNLKLIASKVIFAVANNNIFE